MLFTFVEVVLRPAPTDSFSGTCLLPSARSNGESDEGLPLALCPEFFSCFPPRISAEKNRDCCPSSDLPACSLQLVPVWWTSR